MYSKKAKRTTDGYRSGFEKTLAKGVKEGEVLYEACHIPYTVKKTYTPDFILPKQCIMVEAKGWFTPSDRTKMIMLKQQYPTLDIRFLFQRDNKLSKTSKTTYTQWARKNNFEACVGKEIPSEWLKHKPSKAQKEIFVSLVDVKKFKENKTLLQKLFG